MFEHRSQKDYYIHINIRLNVHSILKPEIKITSNLNNSNFTYDERGADKIHLLLARARNLQDKISLDTINQKEKREFTTIFNEILILKYFKLELCEELLNQNRWKNIVCL